MNLEQLRAEIDTTDREILALFKRRMELVEGVAAYKISNNLPIYQPQREQELLERIGNLAGENLRIPAQLLFTAIMDISKESQQKVTNTSGTLTGFFEAALNNPETIQKGTAVACQGIEGAYSCIAADKILNNPAHVCYTQFEDVFAAVENGECDYGILPIENSSAGSVTQVYDLLRRDGFCIIKAYSLKITHCLLAPKDAEFADIQRVYSHPQALSQCSAFFSQNRALTPINHSNTAAAAQYVAQQQDKASAAIASEECAALYGLKIIKQDIQNAENNYTKFILISKKPIVYKNANKISLVLKLPHTPGSLYRLISRFAARGLNLTKIESRPIPEVPFEFLFYFEFDGNVRDKNVQALLESLNSELEYFRLLGNFKLWE